jgi:hypothetical protein
MSSENGLRAEAELIIDTCFSVEKEDVVTIIHDDSRVDEARMLAEVAGTAARGRY